MDGKRGLDSSGELMRTFGLHKTLWTGLSKALQASQEGLLPAASD